MYLAEGYTDQKQFDSSYRILMVLEVGTTGGGSAVGLKMTQHLRLKGSQGGTKRPSKTNTHRVQGINVSWKLLEQTEEFS